MTLAGCGSDNSSNDSSSGGGLGVDGVHVSGDVGTSASVKFDGQLTDTTATTKVLSEGSGDKIALGDAVVVQTVLADGFTQKTVQDTYQQKTPQLVPVSD